MNEATRDKLVSDLKQLTHDAEELLKVTADDVGERAKEARAKLAETLEKAKATCRRLEVRAIEGAKATDKVIREHPYESIGAAFGMGLLLGLLIRR